MHGRALARGPVPSRPPCRWLRRRLESTDHHLRDTLEIPVERDDRQAVLSRRSGDPEVVRRHGRALSPEVIVDRRVSVGGLVIDRGNATSWCRQELLEQALVLQRPATLQKARTQLPENDGAKPQLGSLLHDRDGLRVMPEERSVCRGVQEEAAHFHISGSICRCSRSAAMNSRYSSSDHCPAR